MKYENAEKIVDLTEEIKDLEKELQTAERCNVVMLGQGSLPMIEIYLGLESLNDDVAVDFKNAVIRRIQCRIENLKAELEKL